MKNNGLQRFERMADVMFSDRFQAKAIIATFGTLGVICLIGAFWKPVDVCGYMCRNGSMWIFRIKK